MYSFLLDPSSTMKSPQWGWIWWLCGRPEFMVCWGSSKAQCGPRASVQVHALALRARGWVHSHLQFNQVQLARRHRWYLECGWGGKKEIAGWVSNSRKTRPAKMYDSISLIWVQLQSLIWLWPLGSLTFWLSLFLEGRRERWGRRSPFLFLSFHS